jgi:Lrp/AsnC family transcriptional regulator for asnA, asnC and gidA
MRNRYPHAAEATKSFARTTNGDEIACHCPNSPATLPSMAKTDSSAVALDDISKSIIEQLQKDGRAPYAAIGKAVGLSEAAVRQRVQRMLDAGVVQVVAVSNPLHLGFNRAAMIGLKVEGSMEAVAEQIAAMPEIDYVVVTAGSFDLLCEVVCESDEQLLEILQNQIRAIPGVRSSETFVYLKLLKQTYQWGTR